MAAKKKSPETRVPSPEAEEKRPETGDPSPEVKEKRNKATAEKTAAAKKADEGNGARRLVIWVGENVGGLHRFDSGWENEMRALVEKYAPGREGLLVDPKDAPRAIAEIDAKRGFYSKF